MLHNHCHFQTGRVEVTAPKVSGHSGSIQDIKWSPFSDHLIASCSDDQTVSHVIKTVSHVIKTVSHVIDGVL